MKIDWTVRGAQVPDPLRRRVEQQLGKLDRYFRGHVESSVVVAQQGDPHGTMRYMFEGVVRNRLGTFAAREESHELGEAANAVLKRLEAQVQKAHDKRVDNRRRAGEEEWPVEAASGE